MKYLVIFILTLLLLVVFAQKSKEKQKQSKIESQKSRNISSSMILGQQLVQTSYSQKTYQRISSYNQYIQKFEQKVKLISGSQIFNATSLLKNSKQVCENDKPCQFFYYIIPPKSTVSSSSRKIIFIVSGMHGNQYLGPMTLFHGLNHFLDLYDAQLIIFPISNPSGFVKNQRVTFPTNIDPNRDYPIQSYKICYQAASTIIIDHIYRTYQVQLTVGLHNGGSEIGFNWGTVSQFTDSHTKDYQIYSQITEMLKFYGGYNKKANINSFKTGTMDEIIYPASGTFDDWAYAASWYPKKVNSKSFSCQYQEYPANMTNGLVFLMELGPFNVQQVLFGSQKGVFNNPNSNSLSNGYISRSIRMIKKLLSVSTPVLKLKFTQNQTIFKLQGCKYGQITNLLMIEKSPFTKKQQQTKLNLSKTIIMNGSVNYFNDYPLKFKLNNSLQFEQVVEQIDQNNKKNLKLKKMKRFNDRIFDISYTLKCDDKWLGKGNTNFAKGRQFKRVHQIKLIEQEQKINGSILLKQEKNYYQSSQQAIRSFAFIKEDQNEMIKQNFEDNGNNSNAIVLILIVGPILIVLIFGMIIICRQMKKQIKSLKFKKHPQMCPNTQQLFQLSQSTIQCQNTPKQDQCKQKYQKIFIKNVNHQGKAKEISQNLNKEQKINQTCISPSQQQEKQEQQYIQLEQFVDVFQQIIQK